MKHTRVPCRPVSRTIEWLEDRILLTIQDVLNAATPVSLVLNQPSQYLSGQIDPPSDVNLYAFSVFKGQTLTAVIDGQNQTDGLPDSEIALFDSTGMAIQGTADNQASNDDQNTAAGIYDSGLVYTFDTAGTYYLGVTSNDNFNISGNSFDPNNPPSFLGDGNGGSTGNYNLALELTDGDTLDTAVSVGLQPNSPEQRSSEITPAGDVDIYKIHLAVGDTISADVADSNGDTLKPTLRLFYNGQAVIANSVSSAASAHLDYQAAQEGDYFVAVSDSGNTNYDPTNPDGRTGTSSGEYVLTLLRTPFDNNDTRQTATPVSFVRDQSQVQPVPGNKAIVNSHDVDLYKVANLVVGDTLQLNIDTQGGTLQPRLRMFDPNGIELSPNNGGSPLDSIQTFTIATVGTYYVGVSGVGNDTYDPQTTDNRTAGSTGDYQLTVSVNSGTAVTAETESSDTLSAPHVINVPSGSSQVTGHVDFVGDADYYMFTVSQSGLYTGQVTPGSGSDLDGRLTMYGADQQVWTTSDDQALNNLNPLIQANLVAGTYFLKVDASPAAGAGANTGAYTLSSKFQNANSPFGPQPVGPDLNSASLPVAIAYGDFNNDGLQDLISVNQQSDSISVLLAVNTSNNPQSPRANFSYQPAIVTSTNVGYLPQDVVVGQFNPDQDHNLDIALVNSGDDTVQIFLGNGDGTFTLLQTLQLPSGSAPWALVAASLNASQDQFTDLAIADSGDGSVRVFLGSGNGNFTAGDVIAVGTTPKDIIAGNFDNDSHIDLATADSGSGTVTVLYGDGMGAFDDTDTLDLFSPSDDPTTFDPTSLVAGNFNKHDAQLGQFIDFAVADAGLDEVSVIIGTGNRSFVVNDPVNLRQGALSTADGDPSFTATVAVGDFNGDQLPDLVLSTSGDSQIAVALGLGNGTFAASHKYASNFGGANIGPRDIVVHDLNGDGRDDFATADGQATTANANPVFHVSVFAGRGDGTFQSGSQLDTGPMPFGLAAYDLNSDGQIDLVTANNSFNPNVAGTSVLLGVGDGSFQEQLPTGDPAASVAVGDINGDGRPDLVITTSAPVVDDGFGDLLYGVEILLGVGDGTYVKTGTVALGDFLPGAAVTIGKFDVDDPLPEVAVADQSDNQVVIYRVNADGTFADAGTTYQVGNQPWAMALGDFNGDGKLDLVTSNSGSGDISILLGNGDGSFQPAISVAVGQGPGQLAVGNFNGDQSPSGHGIDDIAVKSSGEHQIAVVFGNADGVSFTSSTQPLFVHYNPMQAVTTPEGIVAVDLNGDGLPDFVTANNDTNDISVFLNQGNGQFAPEQISTLSSAVSIASGPASIVAGDFNGDGAQDVAVSNSNSNNVSVMLGLGNGTFAPAGSSTSSGLHKAPLLTDFNGDGTPDSVSMDSAGRVLLRLGRPGEPGVFAPPLVVNAASIAAGMPAADFALFNDGSQHLLGILNRTGGQSSPSSVFTLYRFNHAGAPIAVTSLQLGDSYDRIVAAKINSSNRDDLVALDSANGMLAEFTRSGTGFVALGQPVHVANAPSALMAANLGTGGLSSVVVANQQNGTLNIVNRASPNSVVDYRISTQTAGFVSAESPGAVAMPFTFDGASALAVGNFNDLDDTVSDMVAVHAGTNTLSVLLGKSGGGFADPQPDQEFQTGSQPIAVAAGKFNADKHLDLAVLEADGQVQIFLGDGHGNFQLGDSYDVVTSPVALAVYKVNGDNKNDLMISNRSGDVVTLLGNGNGTFRSFTRAGQNMGLAVGDGNVVITNQSNDRVVVPGSQQVSQRSNGVNAPTAVRLTDNLGNPIDLNADGLPDMVVANSGGNNVLVYLGTSGGGFGLANPISFSTGTDPVDVEVADINGDGKQDVIVTNYGSNDVSILLGTGDSSFDAATGKSNLLKPGVRLNTGQGPVSTQVVLQPGHANPDLLVTNSISNSVYLLAGLGGGFFNDVTPTQFQTGSDPVQTVVGNFNGQMGFVTLNYASNSLTFYSSFSSGGGGQEIASGGANPLTAVAFGLNSDGTTDLIVGNNGDGVFSVFEGQQAGLSLVNSFTGDALSHPAALAVTGQGQDLQLLALDEGDESVHVFDRDAVSGQEHQFIPAQTEFAAVATGVLGTNTTGFSFAVSLFSALGLSIEGFRDQSFTGDAAGGDGKSNSHPFSADFFEDLGSALDSSHHWVDSALEGLGLHLDDHEVGAAVEDVMSLIFPHLPWQALPPLIHGVLESASHNLPSSPFAADQALEQFDANLDLSVPSDLVFSVSQVAGGISPSDFARAAIMPFVKSLVDSATSAVAPRADAPSDVVAGQAITEKVAHPSRCQAVAAPATPLAAFVAPQNIALTRKLASPQKAADRVSKALQMSLGLPVSMASRQRDTVRNPLIQKFNRQHSWQSDANGASGRLFALAAVLGSVGAGGWAHRFRCSPDQNKPFNKVAGRSNTCR